jgi:hypothetical protein
VREGNLAKGKGNRGTCLVGWGRGGRVMGGNGDEDTAVPHKLKLLESISDLSCMIECPFAL